MIVVTLTDCPPRLRGDLTKWLQEINTGVYVGQLNSRVREKLRERICENLPRGRATMVYSANNEQRMEFRVHNTTWQPVDFEGLTLMRRPITTTSQEIPKNGASKAAVNQMTEKKRSMQAVKEKRAGYVVVDIETTGLDYARDEILELGAIRVVNHEVADSFSALIRIKSELPREISELTGITEEMISEEGTDLKSAVMQLWNFIGQSPVVGHNLRFDRAFLTKASEEVKIQIPRLSFWDTLTLARRNECEVSDYRLGTLAAYFEIEVQERHRALSDCMTTFQVYEKLNEI